MSNRGNWERREARRQRDREWCEVRLVMLRLVHGYDQGTIDTLRKTNPTKGMLAVYLRGHTKTRYLAKDKLYVEQQPPQEA